VYSQYSASCTAVDIADGSGKAICLPDVVPTSLPTIFKGEVACKVSLHMYVCAINRVGMLFSNWQVQLGLVER